VFVGRPNAGHVQRPRIEFKFGDSTGDLKYDDSTGYGAGYATSALRSS